MFRANVLILSVTFLSAKPSPNCTIKFRHNGRNCSESHANCNTFCLVTGRRFSESQNSTWNVEKKISSWIWLTKMLLPFLLQADLAGWLCRLETNFVVSSSNMLIESTIFESAKLASKNSWNWLTKEVSISSSEVEVRLSSWSNRINGRNHLLEH